MKKLFFVAAIFATTCVMFSCKPNANAATEEEANVEAVDSVENVVDEAVEADTLVVEVADVEAAE